MGFKFEDLRFWQRSLDVATEIHFLVKGFPKEEMYSLSSQMKRAADSISLNIAEGSTGQTDKQQSKFLGYSIRSGIEVIGCLYLAKKRDYLTEDIFRKHYTSIEGLIVSIQALRKTLKIETK